MVKRCKLLKLLYPNLIRLAGKLKGSAKETHQYA
jgi:hypothetical protein